MRTSPVNFGASEPATGQAFTLIEIMLAVAIFSIVLVAIHMVFYGAVQLRNKTVEAVQQQIPLQQALSIMKRDLQNVVMPGGTFFGELQTSTQNSAMTNTLSLLNPVNDALPGQSGPAFFTASGSVDEFLPWGDIQRVCYFLAPPTNRIPGKVLVRSVTRNLLPSVPEQPENQTLLNGLQSIAFYYYDGLQWRNYWDSTQETNKLPFGFKIEIQFMPDPSDRGVRPPLELVVPVVLQPGTNQVEQSTGGEA